MPPCSMSHVLGARQLGERWGCNGDLEDRKIRKPLAERRWQSSSKLAVFVSLEEGHSLGVKGLFGDNWLTR